MSTTFFYDTQDPKNPSNGRILRRGSDLLPIVRAAAGRPAFVITLESATGLKLDVGIGPSLGTLHSIDPQFVARMAYLERYANERGDLEYLMASSPSPIAKKYGLPMRIVLDVAAAFIDSGTLSDTVRWELV